MVQRIQTVWLSLCIVLSLLLLKGSMVGFTSADGMDLAIEFKGLVSVSGKGIEILQRSLLIPVVLIMLPVASLAGILLFRKSFWQKTAVWIVIAASALLYGCGFYYWRIASVSYRCSLLPGIKIIIPAIIIVLAILAIAGIRNDEKLVRSYDRLRQV